MDKTRRNWYTLHALPKHTLGKMCLWKWIKVDWAHAIKFNTQSNTIPFAKKNKNDTNTPQACSVNPLPDIQWTLNSSQAQQSTPVPLDNPRKHSVHSLHLTNTDINSSSCMKNPSRFVLQLETLWETLSSHTTCNPFPVGVCVSQIKNQREFLYRSSDCLSFCQGWQTTVRANWK